MKGTGKKARSTQVKQFISHLLLVDLRIRTGEERRRQTLCDKRDNNFVEITFRQTSLSFKQIFL